MIQQPPADDCPPDLIPTRASLLGRLKDWDDQASWRDFFNTYWKLIYGFALQRGLTHSEAEEVVQESRWLRLVIELFPRLAKIRRFRLAPVRHEGRTGRLLQRRIAGEIRQREREAVR